MPELCRFYGIIIYMYREIGGRHHFPHIHASYADFKAVFHIETAQLMEGVFPRKEQRLIEAWIELRKDKLKLNWLNLNASAEKPSFFKIEPLQQVIIMADLQSMAISKFALMGDYSIKLTFADNSVQTIDFEPVIGYGWMQELLDLEYFRKVSLNEGGNIEWPNGQDFNPEALYDWDNFKHIYIEEANRYLKQAQLRAALRLARFFNVSADFWLSLQVRGDLYNAQQLENEDLNSIQDFAHFRKLA